MAEIDGKKVFFFFLFFFWMTLNYLCNDFFTFDFLIFFKKHLNI